MADIRQKPAPLSVSGEVATVPEYVPQYIFIQRAILELREHIPARPIPPEADLAELATALDFRYP